MKPLHGRKFRANVAVFSLMRRTMFQNVNVQINLDMCYILSRMVCLESDSMLLN